MRDRRWAPSEKVACVSWRHVTTAGCSLAPQHRGGWAPGRRGGAHPATAQHLPELLFFFPPPVHVLCLAVRLFIYLLCLA